MPIYEFYCAGCHRLFSFLSRGIDTTRQPPCPKCAQPGLQRRVSAFAISKGRPETSLAEAPGAPGFPDLDDGKLERLMSSMAAEADGVDEEDPRQQARLMRKLFDAAGLPMAGGMQEALKRLEAGEDPETVEQELGDTLGDDPFAASAPGGATLRRLRQALPPSVDPTLYEM
jgi:putative FmdB family regulatory protein